ncbi:MAG: hypothetical protein HRU51_05820, partial [Xanthomonadales bacterium]|nr:hypothetical protein [Xanthomonadales bacterium]
LPELAEQDLTPRVRLFGDGRLLIHRPSYMKRSGTWETQIEPAEVDNFLQSVVPTLFGFDDRSVRLDIESREKKISSQRSGVKAMAVQGKSAKEILYARFDAPISYFELNIKAFGRPGSGVLTSVSAPVYVAWEGLSLDLRRFPDQSMLKNLHAVESTVRSLEDRDDLVLITNSVP